MLDVSGVPLRIVGLHFDHDGVFETGGLEGLVPLEHGGADGVAKLDRCGVFDPEDDRLHGFAELRAGLLLHEIPAVNNVAVGRGIRAGHVGDLMREVADAGIVDARFEIVLGHRDERVLHLHRHIARVGDVLVVLAGRGGVFIDILGNDGGVSRVAVDAHDLGLRLGEFSEEGLLTAVLHLGQGFAQKQVGSRDEHSAVVLGGDALGGEDGGAHVRVARLGEGVLRIEIERGVLLDEFDASENAPHREDNRVAVAAAVVAAGHGAVHAVVEIDELGSDLVLGDVEPDHALFVIKIGAKQAIDAFEVLGEFSHRFALGFDGLGRRGGLCVLGRSLRNFGGWWLR